jgi:hypothetical protein
MPPFIRWDHFMTQWRWKTGEHITTIGPTGSGKTVLNRMLLRRAPIPGPREPGPFVVVLGIKNRDPELYGPYQKEGYELVRKFESEPTDEERDKRVIFAPRSSKHGDEGAREKAKAFRAALHDILEVGYWTVYADDIQFMAVELKLNPEFKEMWQIGRSEGISLVASSQEPVDIPPMAYNAATHLFLFKNTDDYRVKRLSELAGVNREIVRETIPVLPDHEFVYFNKSTGQILRSKVIL